MVFLNKQSGSGLAEFSIVALPIIFMGLAGIELSSWLNTRQVLSLALVQAARAGITDQARPETIAKAFEHSLNMLYPQKNDAIRVLQRNQAELNVAWQIKIYHPGPRDYLDHGQQLGSKPTIKNSYQQLQHASNLKKPWTGGLGPNSASNIFAANTLELELTWPHKPALPFLKGLLKTLAPMVSNHKSIFQAGYLPFNRTISMPMQSDPILWPELSDKRVIYADSLNIDLIKIDCADAFSAEDCLQMQINKQIAAKKQSDTNNEESLIIKQNPDTESSLTDESDRESSDIIGDEYASCDLAY